MHEPISRSESRGCARHPRTPGPGPFPQRPEALAACWLAAGLAASSGGIWQLRSPTEQKSSPSQAFPLLIPPNVPSGFPSFSVLQGKGDLKIYFKEICQSLQGMCS